MKKNHKRAIFSFILFPCCFLTSSVRSQQSTPTWQQVVDSMPDPTQVKSLDASFRLESYASKQAIQVAATNYAKAFLEAAGTPQNKTTYPWDRNPSGISLYRVKCQGERFRCDRSRVYPINSKTPVTGYELSDGEKLYDFDGQFFHGTIEAPHKSPGFFQSYEDINYLGWPGYVDTFKKRNDIVSSFLKKEATSDGTCLIYTLGFRDEIGRIVVSVCPEKSYAFKRLESYVFSTKDEQNGTAVIYTANQLQKGADGFYSPTSSQIDIYKIKSKKMIWSQTTKCVFSNVEFNSKIPEGTFDTSFPLGTLVMNELDSPGQSEVEGGRYAKSVDDIERGYVPSLSYPDGTQLK